MSAGITFVLGFGAWLLIGMIVVETCRIWRAWWVNPLDLSMILLWPVVLFFTVRNGPDQ